MKKISLFALLAMFSFAVHAQSKSSEAGGFKFGIGPALSIPTGDLGTITSVGYGAELQGTYGFSESLEGFLQAGYSSFTAKNGGGSALGFIPVLAGARYNANGFKIGAGLGYGSYSANGTSLSGFTYSPQVGYSFEKIDILAHYTATSVTGGTFSSFGIKVFKNF